MRRNQWHGWKIFQRSEVVSTKTGNLASDLTLKLNFGKQITGIEAHAWEVLIPQGPSDLLYEA